MTTDTFLRPQSQEQIDQIKEYFQVFDPISCQVTDDFSKLEKGGVQLVCIGESHGSPSQWKAQSIAFQILAGNHPGVVLLEGEKPEVELPKAPLFWSDTSKSLRFIGADIRRINNKDEPQERSEKKEKWTQNVLAMQSSLLSAHNKLQSIISDETTCQIYSMTRNESHDWIPKNFRFIRFDNEELELQFLDWIKSTSLEWANSNEKSWVTNPIKSNNVDNDNNNEWPGDPLGLLASNKNLANQAVSAVKKGFQTFAIWGKNHFTHDLKFHQTLNAHRIHYLVLLPGPKLWHLGRAESLWCYPTYELKEMRGLTNNKNSDDLTAFASFNHITRCFPQLFQTTMYPAKSEPAKDEICYQAPPLNDGKVFILKKDSLYKLQGVAPSPHRKLMKSLPRKMHLIEAIASIGWQHGLGASTESLSGFTLHQIDGDPTANWNELPLKIKFNEDTQFTFSSSNPINANINDLFYMMVSWKKKQLQISLKQKLLLRKSPQIDKPSDRLNIEETLNKITPPGFQVSISGDFDLTYDKSSHTIEMIGTGLNGFCIKLITP